MSSSGASSSRRSGSMTKEQLKSALVANRVPLPPGSAKKEEYQRLYDERVVSHQAVGDFSSDEETDNVEMEAVASASQDHAMDNGGGLEVNQMTNEELYEACCQAFGKEHVGPVMDNTRSLYMKKLDNYLFPDRANGYENGLNESHDTESNSNGPPTNGHNNTYSDSDEDVDEVEEVENRTAARGSSRASSSVAMSQTHSVSAKGKRRSVSPIRDEDEVERVGRNAEIGVQASNKRHKSVGCPDIGVGPLPSGSYGISYFKERPGYPSFTTSNCLPFKPFVEKKQPVLDPKPEYRPSPWVGAYALVALLGMLGAIFYFYYTNGEGAAIQQKEDEELDEILNALQDEQN